MPQYITKEGLQKLKDELKDLKDREMKRIVKLIAEAASFGDLKENAAYHEARNMKSFLLGKIEQLENAVNEAIIVGGKGKGEIQVGSEITISFGGQEEKYSIVAPAEADILNGKISYESPLGKRLLGKKNKEKFDFQSGEKKIKVKILSIK